jgi:short-subunit dehydrogenase
MMEQIARRGLIDVLVNNAGIIEVGPIDTLDAASFGPSIRVNLMGMIHVTLAALPHMRRGARILNITSIGAAVAIPHLITYSVSKFGALGFSLGLDAELAPRGISVTSVLPGLMRTGSFKQAYFRGRRRAEFDWFALGGALPGPTISAEHAARLAIRACVRRRRFVTLGPQAKALRALYQVFPGPMLALMRGVARLLPGPAGARGQRTVKGKFVRDDLPRGSLLTRAGDRAGDRLNEGAA